MPLASLLPYAPAAIRGVTSIGRFAARRKKKPKFRRFDETAYAKFLKRGATEGIISPKAERTILGRVGRETGSAAQIETARIGGKLVGGIGRRSIAGIRATGEPGRERIRKIGDIAREIAIENELSKTGFEERYAIGQTEDERRRVAEERGEVVESRQRLGDLIGGIGQAGLDAYKGLRREKFLEEYPEEAKYAAAAEADVRLPSYAGRGEKSFEEKLQEMASVLKMLGLID